MKNIKTVSTLAKELVNIETGEVLDVSTNTIDLYVGKEDFALIYSTVWSMITKSNLSRADIEMFGYLFYILLCI